MQRSAHVESVYLGNLPGFGGPWLTQYAHHLALSRGPIALMHVDDEQIDLELIGAAQHRRELDTLSRAASSPASDGLLAALDSLAADHLPPIGAFLLHLPEPLSETSLALSAQIDNWALVCSSDQAAIVSAYRWIKGLLEDQRAADIPHRIGLMVMGCDDATAQETATKLSETSGSFLDTDIDLIGSLKQMVPVQLRTLGSFKAGPELWPSLVTWLRDRAAEQPLPPRPLEASPTPTLPPSSTLAPPPPPPPRETMTRTQIQIAAEEDGIPTPEIHELLPPPELAAVPPAISEAVQLPEATEPLPASQAAPDSLRQFVQRLQQNKKEAVPVVAPVAAAAVAPAAPPRAAPQVAEEQPVSLASLIKDQTVTALQARSPYDTPIQFGVDTAGRLQLMLHHVGDPGTIHEAIARLAYVGHWAALHAELLKLTAPDTRIDPRLAPAMHVFTEHGKAAAAMVARVDDQTHLHLLQKIVIGATSTWFCTTLK